MDLGEFGFWLGEAVRHRAGRREEAMQDMRAAMWATADDFDRAIGAMRSVSVKPDQSAASVRDNWKSLMKRGRG